MPLFDWDEVNFAECAREMRLSGEYIVPQIGFLPFWEKPPLFFWLQALFMEVFGENAWGARLPNVIISTGTLFLLIGLGARWHGGRFGLVWAFLYGISLLPSFYARSGLIDPLFNLCMLLATLAGAEALNKPSSRYAMGMGLLAGLATLTKGPVGLLLPALAVGSVGILHRQMGALLRLTALAILPYALLVGGWIVTLRLKGSSSLLQDFWTYQWRLLTTPDAGHAGPWYYHIGVLLIGMFPASVWAVRAWQYPFRSVTAAPQALLFLTLWTVGIFSAVQTKIVHYSSLAYYGIAYLAAWVWHEHRPWIHRWGWLLISVPALLLGLLTVAAGLFMAQLPEWSSLIRDPFVQAILEDSPLRWSGVEGWPGLWLIGGVSILFLLRLRSSFRLVGVGVVLATWQLLTLSSFANRIEAYSQAPLREFCQQAAQEAAVVWPIGFKSYIPFFYGAMQPEASPRLTGDFLRFQNLLLSGQAPFPVYFVSRVDRYEPFMRAHNLQLLARKGGYVLLGLPPTLPPQAETYSPQKKLSF